MIDIDLASVLVALCGVCASAILSVIAIAFSLFSARKYGDLAGTRAAIQYEEEQAATARRLALQALKNEARLARAIAGENTIYDTVAEDVRGFSHLPLRAFETAFSVGGVLADADSQIIEPITKYLTEARRANALIDLYVRMAGTLDRPVSLARPIIEMIENESVHLFLALDSVDESLDTALSSIAPPDSQKGGRQVV